MPPLKRALPRCFKALTASFAVLISSYLLPLTSFAANDWVPIANISATTTLVTNSLCYTDGTDLVCNGAGPAIISSSPTISTGLSGSIVYRDQTGLLIANNTFSISSTTGSVGIGAGAPAYAGNDALFVSGTAVVGTLQSGGSILINSSAARYLSFGSGANSILGDGTNKYLAFTTSGTEALRIVSTGYVGIGTTAPAGPLDVSGSQGRIYVDAAGSSLYFTRNSSNYVRAPGAAASINFATGGSTVRMGIDSAGLVGINLGSTVASTTLHVSGTIRIADGAESCDTNRLGAIKYASSEFSFCRNGTTWETLASIASGDTPDHIISGTTGVYTYNNTSASIATAGVERMVIGTSGNVGVGQQPTVTDALAISGSVIISSTNQPLNLTRSAEGRIALFNATNQNDTTSLGIYTYFNDNVTTYLRDTAMIYAPIETSNIQLSAISTTGSIRFNIGGYTTTASERMRITSTSIGINTATPSTTLHVSGTIRIADGAESCDTNRLGAIRYAAGSFDVCKNTSNGWEPLSTSTSSTTPSISTGLSGSLVFRDEYGYLQARSSLAVSSTTGSIGIGAGAPAGLGFNGLYASGHIQSAQNIYGQSVYASSGPILVLSASTPLVRPVAGFSDPSITLSGGFNMPEALRIVSTGYVGFGITAPSATIHASGSILATTDISIGERSGTATPRILFKRSLDGSNNAYIGLQASGGSELRSTNSAGSSYYTWYTNDGSTTAERLRLHPSGNLGIGTTTPSTSLHVSGTIRIADGAESCDTNRLGAIKYTGGEFSFCRNGSSWETLASIANGAASPTITTGVSGSLIFRNNTGALFADSNYFYDTTNNRLAGASFRAGTTGAFSFGSTTDNNAITGNANSTQQFIAFKTSNSEVMRIVSTGLVGIGTTAPNAKLEVIGTISATSISTTALTVNGVAITGDGAGASTFASLTDVSYSLALGSIFGPGSTTGAYVSNSTAFGVRALRSSTSGHTNTAIGNSALTSNTTGNQNTAIGANALRSNTTGYYNTAVGFSALNNNTTGYFNTAFGYSSLSVNTTGYGNSSFGLASLDSNILGYGNVAMGRSALSTNINGDMNTAIGYYAGYGTGSNSTDGSTFIGAYSGYAISTGNSNTLVGYNAGAGITSGNNNLVLGNQTTPFSNTGDNQLNIANAIWGNIGAGTGNANLIGINVTSPTTAFEVSGTISTTALTVNGVAITGAGSTSDRIISSTSGVYVSSTGVISLATNGSNPGYFNAAGLVINGISTTSTISTTRLYVAGDITYTGDIYGTSDRRLKTAITPISSSLEMLTKLQPVSYQFRNKLGHTEYGFIAQEVQKLYPSLVGMAADASGTLSLNYTGLIAPMVRSIQEVDTRVSKLEAENASLRAELNAIRAEVRALAAEKRVH